ncbi:MAG TPA: chromosomal replication initiator protein DnaA [Bryobacteraceae bacterium]|nr:chromosomal replication initiator protein DnaA [Bryobacteraceae bacterium]
MELWEQVKERLAARLTWESYQNWVARTSQRTQEGQRLVVVVPNQVTRDWLEKELGEDVRSALRELKAGSLEVVYAPGGGEPAAELSAAHSEYGAGSPESLFGGPVGSLNERYTFESFVVGSCNQFAHAASRAVAEMPARTYNPLFIYGGVGMGKTHLIHAIGHELLKRAPNLRIVYTSSERFMNQLITCIRTDRMSLFHQHYRSADVLLVDDVHILANRERTQEEFFHTFNELYDHQKQIVLSSDSAPKNTTGLVDRLRSRFEWGLLVDVQAPDLETKMAILDKKAEQEGIQLPEDVRVFIATKTRSNVRELEGALIKLLAYSSVTNEQVTIDMARQVLKHLHAGSEKKITIDSVVRLVADKFSLQPGQIKQKTNAPNIAYPRQVAMYLVKELTNASLPEIGRYFSGKHHTTVLHSIQKIEQLRHRDADLNRLIHSTIDSFN